MRYKWNLFNNFITDSLNKSNHSNISLIIQIILFLILLSFTEPFVLSNETSDIVVLIKAKIDAIRIKENPPKIKITDEQLKVADANKILEALVNYEKDPEWEVRHTTHLFIVKIANLQSENIKVRQEVVKRLAEAVYDKTDGGAGTLLKAFKEKDFNDGTKTLIRNRMSNINEGIVGGSITVWLCGIANIQEELPRLKELLIDEEAYANSSKNISKWYYTTAWAARLARARMGVKEDISKCIFLLESEIKKDPGKIHYMLDYLGYIRQPESIKCINSYLNSDLRLPSTNPGMLGEPVSGYVIDILADNLKDFPIKKEPGRGYKQEQIETARKWMSEHKKWQIIR